MYKAGELLHPDVQRVPGVREDGGELRLLLQVCRGQGEACCRREEVHRGPRRQDHRAQEKGWGMFSISGSGPGNGSVLSDHIYCKI